MSSDEGINVVFILEALGRPKEHLVETLEGIIKSLKEEKVCKVIRNKIHEPKESEQHKEIFTSFCEVELTIENILHLILLSFKYMPAHIEIITPEKMTIENSELNESLNELIQRLHRYDDLARILQNEKTILESKLKSFEEKSKSK